MCTWAGRQTCGYTQPHIATLTAFFSAKHGGCSGCAPPRCRRAAAAASQASLDRRKEAGHRCGRARRAECGARIECAQARQSMYTRAYVVLIPCGAQRGARPALRTLGLRGITADSDSTRRRAARAHLRAHAAAGSATAPAPRASAPFDRRASSFDQPMLTRTRAPPPCRAVPLTACVAPWSGSRRRRRSRRRWPPKLRAKRTMREWLPRTLRAALRRTRRHAPPTRRALRGG